MMAGAILVLGALCVLEGVWAIVQGYPQGAITIMAGICAWIAAAANRSHIK